MTRPVFRTIQQPVVWVKQWSRLNIYMDDQSEFWIHAKVLYHKVSNSCTFRAGIRTYVGTCRYIVGVFLGRCVFPKLKRDSLKPQRIALNPSNLSLNRDFVLNPSSPKWWRFLLDLSTPKSLQLLFLTHQTSKLNSDFVLTPSSPKRWCFLLDPSTPKSLQLLFLTHQTP